MDGFITETNEHGCKKLNKNRIFRLIYNSDKISRQEIADQLGLSLPTVNQNLKMLMEDGLIEYVGNFTSTGGRRAQAITIDNNARKAISVNIKADYINVDVVGLKGQIIYSMAVKAHFSKSRAYIEKLTDAVRHAVDYVGADADDILGVGVTVPGILDDEKQILISAPPLKAKNYDFTRLISAIDYPVVVMNDARAEAYADHWFNGKPEDEKYILCLGKVSEVHILTLPQSEMVFITVVANSDIWLFTLEESSACVVRRAVLKHMFQKRYYHQSLI